MSVIGARSTGRRSAGTRSRHADLVITGADVYPVDAARSWAGAVAVRGDRIVAVGSDDEVRELVGPRTEHLHLPGRMVLPGFQDAHVHPPFAGLDRMRVSLHDAASRQECLDLVGRYAQENPELEWITGGGWSMEHFPGGTPVKEDLDAVVGNRAVFLFNRDVHGAWVSTRALELAGITADTPDPISGRVERDPVTGEPTGTLHEGAAYQLRDQLLPPPTRREWEAAILDAQAYLHSLGITGWQDAWVTPATLEAYRSLAGAGRLTARVVGALWWERSRGLEQIPELVEQRERGGAPGFHPRTVKIMADGVLENYTGALLEPYCDGCGGSTANSGLDFVEPDLLGAAVTQLDRLGFQVHMHAIGDRAVRNCLDAVEKAVTATGRRDSRHHIAHVQLVHPADVPRFRELGVVANLQAYWAQSDVQLEELTRPFLGEERMATMYPFGDFLRSGAVLAMGSDWAVSTPDPLAQIEVAVRRLGRGDDAEPFLPDQRIPLPDAISAFTAGSAYVNHDEAGGVLASGRRADLAVVDRNLFACEQGRVGDARVELTVASGRVVHR
ncbi:amidohydrolase [Pseudonocardia nigra]|uniref:amidohydrolase n=1 Tax=Pseudonocardia nigra TaxID=1921578 RepID=UPI001C5F7B01|nr:amidohydrolase [Pseudonocardia nigra]